MLIRIEIETDNFNHVQKYHFDELIESLKRDSQAKVRVTKVTSTIDSLTEEQKQELSKLSMLPDDKIDLSDAPEISSFTDNSERDPDWERERD